MIMRILDFILKPYLLIKLGEIARMENLKITPSFENEEN